MSDLVFLKKKGNAHSNFQDIHWLINDSTENDLLFIKKSEKSEELIKKSKVKAAFVITDSKVIFDLVESAGLVSPENFLESQKFYLDQKYPLEKKRLIGITGTNGKTTVSSIIAQALQLRKNKVLLVGTLGVFLNNIQKDNFYLTTPSYIDLRKTLYKYREDYDFAIFEMSSHALDQERFYKLNFEIIGWTNLTQDHLDYHKTMDLYFESKAKIIHYHQEKKVFVLNLDTHYKEKLKKVASVIDVDQTIKKSDYDQLSSGFKLRFNIENITLARAMLKGICDFKDLYQHFVLPDGRVNLYEYQGNKIIIDSAHTPGALREICSNLKESFPGFRLMTIFGCGGDRDRNKRPKMLKEVLSHSDFVVVTSDNPRSEDPSRIIADILVGEEENKNIVSIVNRAEAISHAISLFKGQDLLLIAGKGHEDYIIVNGEKLEYSDRVEVEKNIYD